MAALHRVQTGRRSPPSNMIRENGIDWFWIFYFWQKKKTRRWDRRENSYYYRSLRFQVCGLAVDHRALNPLLFLELLTNYYDFYSLHLLLLIFLILLRTEHYIRRRQCPALTFFSLSVWGRLGSAYFLLLSRFLAKNNCQISTLRMNRQCSAKRDT